MITTHPPRSPCGSTLHNPSWHSRPDSCWTAPESRWRRGSKHSRPLPGRVETNRPLPGRPQERYPRTRRGRQDPGGQHHRDPRPARAGRGPVAGGVQRLHSAPRSVITQAIVPGTTDRRQPDPASKLIVDGTPIPCLPGRTTPSASRESARPPGTMRPVACTLAGHLARLPATLPGRTHDTTASGPPTSPSRPREGRADLRHVGGKGWAELGMITPGANPPSRPSVPTTSPGASPNHAARQRFYLIPTRIQFHYTTRIPRCQWCIACGDVGLLPKPRLRHRRRRHG